LQLFEWCCDRDVEWYAVAVWRSCKLDKVVCPPRSGNIVPVDELRLCSCRLHEEYCRVSIAIGMAPWMGVPSCLLEASFELEALDHGLQEARGTGDTR
jgi:hypothetical protein